MDVCTISNRTNWWMICCGPHSSRVLFEKLQVTMEPLHCEVKCKAKNFISILIFKDFLTRAVKDQALIQLRKWDIIFQKLAFCEVHIFWEGLKILWNLHRLFVLCTACQIIGEDFPKICGLLRMNEKYGVILHEMTSLCDTWNVNFNEKRFNLLYWQS